MRKSGFTLLELMIAIFILAMSMTILLGTQSTSMRLMGYANNTSVVTMLTRSKMQDIEYEVQRQVADEGVEEDYVSEMHGDFGDEGYEDIRWDVVIQSIELSDEASNSMIESVQNQIYGTGDEGGTLSGNTTITQFLPTMIGFFPTIINQLGQRIRKITLTTTWDYLGVEQTLTVSQFVVILDGGDKASGSAVSGSKSTESTETDDGSNVKDGDTIKAGSSSSKGSKSGSGAGKSGSGGSKGGSGGSKGGSGGSKGGSGGSKGGSGGGSKKMRDSGSERSGLRP